MSNSCAVFRPKYLSSSGTTVLEVEEGATILDIVRKTNVPESEWDYLVVQIVGTTIPQKMWGKVRPIKGAHVSISMIPQGGGGDDGKSVWRIVAMIIIVIVAVYTQQWYLAANPGSFFTAGLISAGISIAGSYLVNKLFPPPGLNLDSGLSGGSVGSQSPTIQGQRNQARQFGYVNRIYGYIRHFPDHGAEPFVQQVGNDSQYLYMLFDFGYGPLKLYNHRIGDNPISNYSGVSMKVHENLTDPSLLELYTRDIQTNQLSLGLTYNNIVQVTSAPDVDGVQLDITFPQGITKISKKDGNRSSYGVSFKLQYRKVGDVVWNNYGKLGYEFSSGTAVADHQWGFPGDVVINPDGTVEPSTGNVVMIVLVGGGPMRVSPNYGKTEIDDPVSVPFGYQYGDTSIRANISEDIPAGSIFYMLGKAYTITNSVSYAPQGLNKLLNISPPLQHDFVVSGGVRFGVGATEERLGGPVYNSPPSIFTVAKSLSSFYTHNIFLTMPERGQYEFQITRVTLDDDEYDNDNTGSVSTSTLTAIRNIKNSFPINFKKGRCVVEMRIKATDQLSGVVDVYSAEASSVLRTFDDGIEEFKETTNHAWAALDVISGTACPRPVSDDMIDFDSFKHFASVCSALDPTGTEPMYALGISIRSETTVLELFRSILGAARATDTIIDGKYGIVVDERKDTPVQVITTMNSWGMKCSRAFSDTPHGVTVSFLDPDNNWSRNEVTAYLDGYDESSASVVVEMPSFGCYRHSEAWRYGRLILADIIARQEIVSITMDVENIICTKGDYVQLQHDAMKLGGLPSRIVAISGSNITLSEQYELGGPNPYGVVIRGEENLIERYTIIAQVDGQTVTLNSAPSSDVRVGDLVVLGELEKIVGDYLVKEILPGEDLVASLKLTNLANEIHDSIDGELPTWSPVVSQDINYPPGSVDDLTIEQGIVYIDRFPHITIVADWSKPDVGVVDHYELYRYIDNGWKLLAQPSDTTYPIYSNTPLTDLSGLSIIGTEVKIKVVPVGPTGLKQSVIDAVTASLVILGDTTAPPAVYGFTSEATRESLQLRWQAVTVEDLAGYLVRYNSDISGVATWANSSAVVQSVGWNNNTVKVSLRPGTYMIRPYDTSGNLGPVSYHTTTVPGIIDYNALDTHWDDPLGWPGLKENLTVVGGNLHLIDPTIEGYYYFSTKSQFIESYVCRLISDTRISMASGSEQQVFVEAQVRMGIRGWTMDEWTPLEIADPLNLNETVYSSWQSFQAGDYTANVFEFRIQVISLDGESLPVVEDCKIEVDMPDRTARGSIPSVDLSTTYRVEFTPYFYDTPEIAILYSSVGSDVEYLIENADYTGFDLTFTVSGGPPALDVGWIAVGYGYRFSQTLIVEE